MGEYRVEIAPSALADLQAIRSYMADELQAPLAADRTIRALLDAISGLGRFPLRNRVVAALPDGRELRRTRAGNYRALYIVGKRSVSVVAVIYGKRDLDKRLAELF